MVKISEFDSNGKEHLIDGLLMDNDYPQLVNKEKLKSGDVIFCYVDPDNESSIKDKLKTKAIQKATKGIYVHCGLYIGNNLIADSVNGGVRHENFDTFANNYDYLVICRCHYLDESHILKMLEYTKACKDKSMKYDMIGALKVKSVRETHRKSIHSGDSKPVTIVKEKNKSFCSEFVVNCFKASGYIPWDHKVYISHAFSPTDLAHDGELLQFEGYISKNGLNTISKSDIFKK